MRDRTEMLEYVLNKSLAMMAIRREGFEKWYERTAGEEFCKRMNDSAKGQQEE